MSLETLGAYIITAPLGEGGMARVFRARHRVEHTAEQQGGDVALKVLHDHLTRRSDIVERFKREAALGLNLDHPGICKVHELLETDSQLAIVMELLDGQALSTHIGEVTGPIPWPRAWPLFEQLLHAVEYAHEQRVIHRDLKPDNVIVGPDGRTRICDFGIAKELDSNRTRTSTGMGSIDYMAPEQWTDAKRIDARADVYSLGMTLYVMLAGRLPWEPGISLPDLFRLQESGKVPPPTVHYPDIPPAVEKLVMRALQINPNDRPESAAALRRSLEATLAPKPEPHTPPVVTATAPQPIPDKPLEAPPKRPHPRSVPWKLVAPVLFGTALLAGYFLAYMPSVADKNALRENEMRLDSRVEKVAAILREAESTATAVETLQADLATIKSRTMLSSEALADLQNIIQKHAMKHGLTVQELAKQAEFSDGRLVTIPLQFEATGTYHATAAFFSEISTLPEGAITVDRLEIKGIESTAESDTPRVEVSSALKTYRYMTHAETERNQ